jgi:hypothetical protein
MLQSLFCITSLPCSFFISRRSKDRWGFKFCELCRWTRCAVLAILIHMSLLETCKFLRWINERAVKISITEYRTSSEKLKYGPLSSIRDRHSIVSGERYGPNYKPVVYKLSSADTKVSGTDWPWIIGCISLIVILRHTNFVEQNIKGLLKSIAKFV